MPKKGSKLPKEKRRTVRWPLRLTKSEGVLVAGAAKITSESKIELVRRATLAEARRALGYGTIKELEAEMRRLVPQLVKAQREMNQGPITMKRGKEIEALAERMEAVQKKIDAFALPVR